MDSHCHLDRLELSAWDDGLDGALHEAAQAGVGHMLCVSINMEAFPGMMELVRRYDNVSASVGVHPNETGGHDPDVEELLTLADDENIVAIGETGLDYFRSEGELGWQRERFSRHIEAAKRSQKPLIIHNRESTRDCLAMMKSEGADQAGGVMHCFVEDWDSAKTAMDLNFYISLSGIVTFKSAQTLKEVARKMPLDRLLVETDSPYLAPVPHRGKKNHPAYVRYVAECIAELKGISFDELARATTENYYRLFNLSRGEQH